MTKRARAAQLLLKMGGKLPDSFFEVPKPKGYVLTEKDRLDIASMVSVPIVERVIEKVDRTEVVLERPSITEVTNIIKELDKDELKRLLYEFLSNNWHGGGNANRNIQLNGVNILRPFTDINLITGSGVTIAATANQTTKYTDINISASGGVGAWQTPPEAVNGVNTVFTVGSSAPTDVVADNGFFFEGQGYTYAGGQITFINPPSLYVRYR